MRITALIIRIIQQMYRDKRTLALLFIAPLFILSLMYFIFNVTTTQPKLGVVGLNENQIQLLEKADMDVRIYDQGDKDTVHDDSLDGLLQMKDNSFNLILENGDATTSKALLIKLNQVVATLKQTIQTNQNSSNSLMKLPTIKTEYLYGDQNTTIFDIFSPILIGFFVFFFVFLISGIGLLRERTTGTLERLLSTPIKRHEIVAGYLIGYGIFAIFQTLIIILFSIKVLDIILVGSIGYVILINLLSALVALSLGILLSTYASSEFQMVQFIPLVIVPQVFFSGIFSTEGMSNWLLAIAKIMPLYYAGDALKGVMYKGWGFIEIRQDLLALAIFAIILIGLNIIALKKYRKV